MDEIKGRLGGLFSGGSLENMLTMETSTLDGSTIRTTVKFTSPFNLPIKITDISGGVACEHGTRLASVQMEEAEVEVQPQGEATLTLVGTLTQEATQHVTDVHGGTLPDTLTPTNISFQAEFYGVTLRLSIGTLGEG